MWIYRICILTSTICERGVGIKCVETPKKLHIKFLKDTVGIDNHIKAMSGDG